MRAIGASRFLPTSDPACLVEFETERPVAGQKDLLVKIEAVSVNPVDTKIRAKLGDGLDSPPRILGWDAAGTVIAIGADVTGFSEGDEVFYTGDLTRPGCNAEFQTVDSRLVGRKTEHFSFAEAACIPLVGLTAWELLFERMEISPVGEQKGQPLLVINGAGGVGSLLIPLARMAGLEVIATASRPETVAWCKSRGAHHVIDHHQPLKPQMEGIGISSLPWIANLHRPDPYWESTADLLAPMGTLGLIVEPEGPLDLGDPLKAKCARIVWEFMPARPMFQLDDLHCQGEILAQLATLCDKGKIPSPITQNLGDMTPESLATAHGIMETGTAHGKLVIEKINRA